MNRRWRLLLWHLRTKKIASDFFFVLLLILFLLTGQPSEINAFVFKNYFRECFIFPAFIPVHLCRACPETLERVVAYRCLECLLADEGYNADYIFYSYIIYRIHFSIYIYIMVGSGGVRMFAASGEKDDIQRPLAFFFHEQKSASISHRVNYPTNGGW